MFKNKTLVIVAVVVVLALLGGAAYLSLSKSSTNQGLTVKTTSSPTTSANGANNTTLAGLLALGQNLRCNFNVKATNGGTTQGTFYVSNSNMRGDFVMKNTDGKENQMSMIRNGDENFIWGPGFPTAIKMNLSLDKLAANAQASQFGNVNQKTNYNCVPWNVDSSLSTPPANIKFTDVGQMMAPQATTGTKNPQTASPCDQISDPTTKASCLKAMQNNGY